MAYQFIHVEAYSRETSKQKTKGKGSLNIRQVIAEAGREQGNCPHVENPQPPEILMGDLHQAEEEAMAWAEQATDKQGRKLRKDGHCLLAGVISLPRSEEEKFDEFSTRSIEYLFQKYGDRLKAVVAHENDEEHPHIHFYVVPRKGENFDAIHEGQRAAKEAKAQDKLKGEQNTAYISAMRGLQDDFSKRVGQPLGLARLGPGRRRLTRKAWQAEQAQAKALAEVERTAKKRHEHYKAQGLAQGKAVGLEQAKEEAKAIGFKVGSLADGFKSSWHKPSQRAKAKAKEITDKAQAYADKVKKQAEQSIQDERNSRRLLQVQLDKQSNIATNYENENKRLKADLQSTEADRQRLLKIVSKGGGGFTGGGTKLK